MLFFTFSSFIFVKASVFLDDFDSKKKSYEKHNKACHQEVQSNDGDLMKHQNNWWMNFFQKRFWCYDHSFNRFTICFLPFVSQKPHCVQTYRNSYSDSAKKIKEKLWSTWRWGLRQIIANMGQTFLAFWKTYAEKSTRCDVLLINQWKTMKNNALWN